MPPLRPDAVLSGRYRLVSPVGAGGNGAVWRAHDDVLDRDVAVKLLHQDLELDEAVRARFRREAMSAASIHHPHAAVVYDIGEDDGRPFLVMELVEGPTLDDLMDGTPIDAGVVAAIGHQVAGALGAAHERGLAHRDVKPGNVLLTHDGAAKVVDFGIAKALGDATQQLTAVGTVVGTAAYLAPEQLEPDAEVDGRADVYALGLLLHELATGRPAFAGTTAAEVAAQRLVADAPAPDERHPTLPEGIAAIIARATRRDPDARFADGGELAAALVPHVPDRPLQLVAEFASRTPRTDPTTRVLPVEEERDLDRTVALDPPDADGPQETMLIPTPAAAETVAIPVEQSADITGDHAERPAPDADGGGRPDASPSPWRRGVWAALAVVGLAVVLALALSDGPGGAPGTDDGGPGPAAGDAEGPHRIVAATDVDPHGGDGEHPEDVGLAFDGDPATAWPTQRYSSAAFGGLKPGVGIAFDLGETVEVSQVELLLATPGVDLEVYASDAPFEGTDLGEPLGAVAEAPAEPTIDVGGARGRYWLVWFTSVPGGRAEVVEAEFDRPA
ncbi:MAG: serine/threonine protein kinase [Actinobacteria bacterium]|nr:serine/threonine protein kinase [Actinomycetota bacterium]